jgi:protocatechuate 3,4-dioxygenase, beta subunit
MQSSRRRFLSSSGLLIGALGFAGKALADSCDFRPTAKQPLGPFYPVEFPTDSDIDLTRLGNSAVRATGDVMIVEGVVTDDMCKPIKGAIVEIWQACHTGRYNHPSDTSGTPLDPNFQYYGVMRTDEQGRYRFKTIKPGAYDASETWRRPPHIHFKVGLRGYRQLVTQSYWEGDGLNDKDLILTALPLEERRKVVIHFKDEILNGEKVGRGTFDMTLSKLN